jgi:cellobiose phosphorylase
VQYINNTGGKVVSGYFDDSKREYKIENMYPKRPWINYLWNESLITAINQFGCGDSWHRDRNAVKTQLCRHGNSRLIFIKDEETEEFWAANRNFERDAFEDFYTNVGQGYSEICSNYKNIETKFKLFIPTEGNFECWKVQVRNTGKEDRKIKLTVYADTDSNITGHSAYNHGEFNSELKGILLSHHGFDLPSKLSNIYFICDKEASSYETTKRRFIGVYGNEHKPDALKEKHLSSEDTSFDSDMIGALQFDLDLKAGESECFYYILGLSTSLEEAVSLREKCLKEDFFERESAKISEGSEMSINSLLIQTPNAHINSLANIWLKRQIGLGKTWGRVYGRGFRDIMQDITGFMPLDTKTAAEKIKYCLNYQYEDGNTLRQWAPYDFHPYRDGASWLVPAVVSYIKETGDFNFLFEEVEYFENKDKGTVLDHCIRGINFLLSERGSHGLCLWGGGDWNDSINNVGMKLLGESVWLSEAVLKATQELVQLLEVIGKKSEAQEYRCRAEELKENILCYGWDRDHFIYGINDWDEKLGAYEAEQGKIYLNPQTWAVISGTVEGKEAEKIMDLIEDQLSCDFGYVQVKPSYSKGNDHIGRISYMEKGAYENGSVYNHGVAFKIAADCKLGRGNTAYESVVKMLSSNDKNTCEVSGVEPYAVTNMYLGPENGLRSGESLMSWITGTAGWLFRCITEFILGVQADYNGLRIDPCIPSHWKDLKVTRIYRNSTYDINIINPKGIEKGRVTITVDGKKIEGNLIPVSDENGEHKVLVELY